MKKVRQRRFLFLGVLSIVVIMSLSACGAKGGLSLSTLLTGEKNPIVDNGNNEKGPEMGSGTTGDGDVVIIGNNGGKDGDIIHGDVDNKPVEPDKGKPEVPVTEKLDKPDHVIAASKPDKGKKLIALTFDDGPDKRYTTDILDILKEKGVKATFFVVGQQVTKNPEVLQRIVDEGHAIGNHTNNHKDLSKLDEQGIIEQFKEADNAIKEAIGITPAMVRAPYGAVSDTVKALVKENHRELIGWNIDTRDWAGTSSSDMIKMIKKEAKPNGMILMHSFGSKHVKNTVHALPAIIDLLENMGYTLVTADQLA
ncbi:polysaccharide deacetylase family protein [Paenibacillus sp. FSL A5-0031]|uniref:polysaccharide deacetylase family protein n=1 Tax=Paenibacillus sp. FSL A5-0031 TaxID=1920420 RepID=UPI0009FAC9DF|nr:polysaccharide deacetylase family protein [Paenibacillus sp. FSL A5-0031]